MWRLLQHHRRFVVTVVGVLGVTAGLVAAAFDVVGAYLWRPLPYPAADRLVVVEYPRVGGPGPREVRRIDFGAVRAFAELAVASDVDAFTVSGVDAPFAVDGRWTSADVFPMFGVVPAEGRFFTGEEARRGDPVALIGYDVWQRRFNGSPSIIGRSIVVRATQRDVPSSTVTVIGVLPRRLWHIETRTDLVLPLNGDGPPMLLRLRPGVSPLEAAARMTALVRDAVPTVAPAWSIVVRDARDAHVARIRPMLSATAGGVVLLAVVAFANLAFLHLARGLVRNRELGVRRALGASRGAVARQLLGEGAVIGLLSAGVAVMLWSVVLRGGVSAVEASFGRAIPGGAERLGREPAIAAAIVGVTMAAAVALALVMLVVARSSTLTAALAGHPAGTHSRAKLLALQAVVAAQVAVAFALLVSASLMIQTAWHLGRVDLGFEPHGVLSANLTLHEATYRTLDARRRFFEAVADRIGALPGVEQVGLTDWLPFRVGPKFTVEPQGQVRTFDASMQSVNAAYFKVLRMRLRDGRLFTPDDRDGRERVAVVGRSLASTIWPAGPVTGQKFRIRFGPPNGRPGFGPFTVVGVVDDALRSLVNPTPPQVYLPFDQQPLATTAFLQIRTLGPPLDAAPEVARAVLAMDAALPLAAVNTLDAIVQAEGIRPRFLAQVLASFASLAVAVAVVGLYAVSGWIAQQRQREAALRVALGATQWSVAARLTRGGVVAIGAGLCAGWIAAAGLTTIIAPELRGVASSDMSTRMVVLVALVFTSMAALWRPAWQAATSDVALRLRPE